MFNFHEGLYTDVRIEDVYQSLIRFKGKDLEEQKIRMNKGAFIRVYDGNRWYYSATSSLDKIQNEIDSLSMIASKNDKINENSIVKNFEVNIDEDITYTDGCIKDIDIDKKKSLLLGYIDDVKSEYMTQITSMYTDKYVLKEFYSSKGANIKHDVQYCGIRLGSQLVSGDEKFNDRYSKGANTFEELLDLSGEIKENLDKSVEFLLNAKTIEPGNYTVLMSPMATGVFTHESFGHKSESDFMIGDEVMIKEWALGKKVGSDILSITDSGICDGIGKVKYDDEGTRGKRTQIIENGILKGRLHNIKSAAALKEPPTGNGRSINFEFEPIVRMTTTYIEKGNRPLKDILSEIEDGVYIDTIKHGSGMTIFTIAPERAYRIKNGKITEPVKISVLVGNVFETLMEVDGVSEEFELLSFVGGGCGKMEQMQLEVGFGGPYTRVRSLNVQ